MTILRTVLLLSALLTGPQCVVLGAAATTHAPPPTTTHPPPTTEERVKLLEQVVEQLSRQLMLQQLYVEESTRSEADSGIKQIRDRDDGTKSYYTGAWSDIHSMAAMHNHAADIRTVGLGELAVVLNGVEFRTRHNDYSLVMPSHHTHEFGKTEDIPFPRLPPAVAHKHTLEEQIAELREWFKAWKEGNHTVRDYRPYFQPLLCYMEGYWTTHTTGKQEPFHSERNHLDAVDWEDLQDKIRFTSYTGDKSRWQNYAYLPTTIFNVTNGEPEFAQWNYRILCHPTKSYVERSEFVPVESLGTRIAKGKTFDDYVETKAARFNLHVPPYNNPNDHSTRYNRLDELMYEIPGLDNYGVNITDNNFGLTKMDVNTGLPLNVGHYHRWYKLAEAGAMGETVAKRGYADRNLFVAVNTRPDIAPMTVKYNCHTVVTNGHRHQACQTATQRVSYAIPLEVIYLTPLQAWNPYNLEYKGNSATSHTHDDGRWGARNLEKALNGTDNRKYYLTPKDFFDGRELERDTDDTYMQIAGVLDRHGNLTEVKASGIRIILPSIPGVGKLRTRYPIMPVSAEGSPVWKELEASWNPFNLEYKGDFRTSHARTPTHTGRTTLEHALNGTDDRHYYVTPATFFNGHEVDHDKCDTYMQGQVGVLDRDGNLTVVRASGVRVTLPNIPGVGQLRTRYPIMPVSSEGSPVWKELEAVRDVALNLGKYLNYLTSKPSMQAPASA